MTVRTTRKVGRLGRLLVVDLIIEIVSAGKSMLSDDVLRREQSRFVPKVDS